MGGGRFGVFIDRHRDRPLRDFTVYSGVDGHRVVIAPGLYNWTQVSVNYLGNASARLYPTFYLRNGGFYDGTYRGYSATPERTHRGHLPGERRLESRRGGPPRRQIHH